MHGAELANFIPNTFGIRRAPVVTHPARQVVDYFDVIPDSRWSRHSPANALHAAFARSDRAVGFAPSSGGRQYHVGQFGSLGIKQILDSQKFQTTQQLERPMAISLGVCRVLAQHIKRGEFAPFHGVEHVAQMPSALGWQIHAPGALEFRS